MTFPGIDPNIRRLLMGISFVSLAMDIPMIYFIMRPMPDEIRIYSVFICAVSLLPFLILQTISNVWVIVDLGKRTISRIYKPFGFRIFTKTYSLDQFNRVSLHRGMQSGYRTTLIGDKQEIIVLQSNNLTLIRETAQKVAEATGLSVTDSI